MLSNTKTVVEKIGSYPQIEETTIITEEIIVVEENITIEDTATDFADIWTDHFVQPAIASGVDIIWVIDPSGSMHDDAPRIIAGIEAMMNALPTNAWRLAIIPADPRFSVNSTDFPLLPGDTAADALNMYNSAVYGAYEYGFDALQAYIDDNTYSASWLRPDASLLVVFVSDEDDQSVQLPSAASFDNWYSNVRSSVFVASIVHLEPSASLCNGNTLMTGQRYIDATNLYNGQVIDICSSDWSAGVADASSQVAPYEHYDLTHTPLNPDYIFVFVDGAIFEKWRYESSENRIYFEEIPPENTLVEISYNY